MGVDGVAGVKNLFRKWGGVGEYPPIRKLCVMHYLAYHVLMGFGWRPQSIFSCIILHMFLMGAIMVGMLVKGNWWKSINRIKYKHRDKYEWLWLKSVAGALATERRRLTFILFKFLLHSHLTLLPKLSDWDQLEKCTSETRKLSENTETNAINKNRC